jgi:hypothetical protein
MISRAEIFAAGLLFAACNAPAHEPPAGTAPSAQKGSAPVTNTPASTWKSAELGTTAVSLDLPADHPIETGARDGAQFLRQRFDGYSIEASWGAMATLDQWRSEVDGIGVQRTWHDPAQIQLCGSTATRVTADIKGAGRVHAIGSRDGQRTEWEHTEGDRVQMAVGFTVQGTAFLVAANGDADHRADVVALFDHAVGSIQCR